MQSLFEENQFALKTVGRAMLFGNCNVAYYWHAATEKLQRFEKVYAQPPFLYCMDEKNTYIMHSETGKSLCKRMRGKGDMYYCYCGESEMGPTFLDVHYNAYIYPTKDGYQTYHALFNQPIIINRRNVANISEGEEGVGVIDAQGNEILSNCYDAVRVELKLTAYRQGRESEKTIPLFEKTFQKGEVLDTSNWI